jgi:CDP-paratose 2-epimerase
VTERPITIYGDGKQVRDLLFVDDLWELYDACIREIDVVAGKTYNVGGGPDNQISLLEFLTELESRLGRPIRRATAATRPGDQPVFVADIRKLERELGWKPRTGVRSGVDALLEWIQRQRRADWVA